MEATKRLLIISAALIGMAMPALAQNADRYQMERTPNGYVRLDKQSGEMSICTEQAGQLVCKLAADDRDAYDSAIDRLGARVDALEGRVSSLESKPKADLPSEQEFEQTMGYMERFFRGFMGIVKEFEQDSVKPEDGPDQRT